MKTSALFFVLGARQRARRFTCMVIRNAACAIFMLRNVVRDLNEQKWVSLTHASMDHEPLAHAPLAVF